LLRSGLKTRPLLAIFQSDNGREFTANIIKELKDMWPDCTLVHGKPRHPQSQGSVERGNCGREDVDSPIFASQPNIALYDDLFIPE
jgi:hypothetical protein